MRLLIDVQGAQTGSRHRGIGRYTRSFVKALLRNKADHEVYLLLNGLFEDTLDSLKEELRPLLPEANFLVFSGLFPVEGLVEEDAWRRQVAELIREWAIGEIGPDILLVTSLFEGAIDNGITSIGRLHTNCRSAVVLYDLIPLTDPAKYLPNPISESWYHSKIEALRKADVLLTISDSARREAIELLEVGAATVKTIYSAADDRFGSGQGDPALDRELRQRVGIDRRFVMHVSACEPRKNFDGLIRAFGLLPKAIRSKHQLVLVSAIPLEKQIELRQLADASGLTSDGLVFAGHVTDTELISLYNSCTLFVFPSLHEGFGLPVLEAMCCGAPVIGSNSTSVPEVIGRNDALFDPTSDVDIARLMQRGLTDVGFRNALKANALKQASAFNWDKTAKLALTAMSELPASPKIENGSASVSQLLGRIAQIDTKVAPSRSDLVAVADAISRTERVISDWRLAYASRGPQVRESDVGYETRVPSMLQGGAPPEVEVISVDFWSREQRPRILLLKLDHIGDFIVTLDAFRLLRNTWPNGHITLVCGPWNVSLAEHSNLFDTILSCRFLPQAGADYDEQTLSEVGLKAYLELPLENYDLAVDLRYYGDTRILLQHTNSKYCAGYSADGCHLDLALPEIPETRMNAHTGARSFALAAAAAWTFGEPVGSRYRNLLDGRTPVRFFEGRAVIGIAPGTGNPIKSWGRDRFAELIRMLHENGDRRFVLFGGLADRADTEFLAAQLPKTDVLDLAGTVNVASLPPLIAGVDLFVGNDTGTTHMAATIGVPTFCIFSGQSHIKSWRPVGAKVLTLRAMVECSPCYLTRVENCPKGHRCMNIAASYVAERVNEILRPALMRATMAPQGTSESVPTG